MGALFSGCSKLAELDLSGIDSSKVTVMDGIFEGCEALDRLTLGEKFAFGGTASELPKAFWQAASTQKIYSSHQIATECKGVADTYAKRRDIKDEVPTITAGANASWHRGMTSGAEFRSSAPLIIFTYVKVDGKVIESNKYDLREGSTIVTLKRDYLASLPNGKHTLEIVSATGTASTSFTVGDDPSVNPGPDDPTPPGPDNPNNPDGPGPTPPGPDNPSGPDDPWQPPSNEGYPMYRLYNPNSGEHFYTSSIEERDHLIWCGWRGEDVGWTAPAWGDPVYRLYNPYAGEHHYTLSVEERDSLIWAGWNDEGIGWYSDTAYRTPLYRLYNPNAFSNNHHYTTDVGERDILLSIGWQDEGVGWHGISR